MRKHGTAVSVRIEAARQLGGIDDIQRHARGVVYIDGLVVNNRVARWAGAGGVVRREQRPVIADVVKQAMRNWGAARDEGQQTWKRIRIGRRAGVGVGHSVVSEFSQRRVRMACHKSRNIQGMQAIDADQQNVFYVRSGRAPLCGERRCKKSGYQKSEKNFAHISSVLPCTGAQRSSGALIYEAHR